MTSQAGASASASAAAPSPRASARERLTTAIRALEAHGPLLFVCTALVLFGVWLRLQRIGFPAEMTWDEDHFVKGARQYLEGAVDGNDHPPLGKLLLAGAIALFGDQSVAWRLPPFLFGLGSIAIGAACAATLFRSVPSAALAAALLAADGFLISYSRTALLDGMLTFFIAASGLAALKARTGWHLLLAGLLGGAATSIKFSGIVTLAPIGYALLTRRPRFRWPALLTPLAVPAVYLALFSVGLAMTGRPFGPSGIWHATAERVGQHLAAHTRWHIASSRWYSWFLPTRPVTLRFIVRREPWVRSMTTLGNPLLWWMVNLALVVATIAVIAQAFRSLRRWLRARSAAAPAEPAAARPTLAERLGLSADSLRWALLLWLAPLVPWIVSARDSYIYHYLPSYFAGVVLVAGLLAALYRRRPVAALVILLVVAEVSMFYAPVWGQLPITRLGWDARMFLSTWR